MKWQWKLCFPAPAFVYNTEFTVLDTPDLQTRGSLYSAWQITQSRPSQSNDHTHKQCFQLHLQYVGGTAIAAGLSPKEQK